jgi:ketosteroid isomerase-like protein
MKARTAFTTILLGQFGMGCQSSASEFTAQDEETVRELFDAVVSDIRSADFAAWAAHFSDNARFYPPHAPGVIGRVAIQTWGEANPPIDEFSLSDVTVVGVGDLAYATSAMVIGLRGLPVDTAKQLVVLRRDATAGWQVVAASVNSDLPLPQVLEPSAEREQ